jgi:intron-binding protein aquarius
LEHIQSRIEKFFIDIASTSPSVEMTTDSNEATSSSSAITESVTQQAFPFKVYFSDSPNLLFNGDQTADLAAAEGCFRHIGKLFEELSDYRAFELLRTRGHRSDYLLTKQVFHSNE